MLNTYLNPKGSNLLYKMSAQIYEFAICAGLVIRKSKSFKPEVFLLALIKAAHHGRASYNNIALRIQEDDNSCSISAQALWKRLTREGCMLEVFMAKCTALICSQGVTEAQLHIGKFKRILTEDSSFVKMIKHCADLFSAHGNKHGSTAGIKTNLIFDLITGKTLELSTHSATAQDRSIAWDILDFLRKGDLVLRDMGYFNVGIFAEIQSKLADWLSRVPVSVKLYTKGGEEIENLLRKSKSKIIDRQIEITESRHEARLVAVGKPKKEADEAVRKLKEAARKAGRTASQKSLTRARWHFLVTSISKDIMTAREIGKLYAQRWQVEIVFKAWKQAGHLEKSLSIKSGYQHMLGIFLAEILVLSLTMHYYASLRQSGKRLAQRLSIIKLSQWVSIRIGKVSRLRELFNKSPEERLVLTEKRERKCQLISMLELLG